MQNLGDGAGMIASTFSPFDFTATNITRTCFPLCGSFNLVIAKFVVTRLMPAFMC